MAAQEVADLSGDTISDMDSGEYIEDAGCDLQAAAHALEQLHMYDRPINCVDLCRLIEIANQYYFRLARLDGRQHQDPQYEGAFLRPLLREGIPAAFNRLMFDEHTPGPDSSVTAHIHAACCGLARLAQVLLLYLWRTDAFSPMLQAQTRLDLSGPLTALTNVLTAQAAFNVRNRCAGPPNGIPIAHPVLAGQRVHDAFRKHQSDLFGTLLFEKLRDVHRQQLASAATGEQGTATSTALDASRPAPSSQHQHGDAHLSLHQTTQRTSQVELQADCLRKAHATLSDQTYLSQLMSDIGEYFFIHNVINHFNQGFDVIAQALKRPDRCGIVGCLTLLQPLQVMFQWLASVNFIKLLPAIQAVLGYIEAGLGAAADFSAFEDSGDDDTREVHAPLLQVVQICWSYSRHPSQLPHNEAATLEARAAALHRETVLRLLASGNFTRQLVGVKEVHTVISRAQWVDSCAHPPSDAPSPDAAGDGGGDGDATGLDHEEESPTTATMMIEAARRGPGSDAPDAGTAGEAPAAVPDEHREDKAAGRIAGVQPDTRGEEEVGDDDKAPANAVMIEHASIQTANPTVGACMSAVLAWFRDNDVVRRILRANLHQSQFVDAAQKALVELLQYDAVEEEHVDFLWHVLEDPTAFEDIKANIYALLGALAPRMRVQQRTNLFSRLCSRLEVPGDVPDLSHVIDMLESMALNDDRGELADDVLRVLLDLVLRNGVPQDVATSPALVNACAAYELSSYNWSATVVNACKAAMNREERGVTVAAAYQLRAIIAFACAKKATQNQFFGRYNRNAALLQHALVSFEAFLEAQAAAAHDAGVPLAKGATPGLGPPYDDAPPASPFTHSTAVHVWHELLLDLVRKGNYFITEQQVVQISSWATVKSVTDVDAAAAWDLLVELVKGRKEINFDVANAFLEVLRATDPIAITQPAWRCITAYAAALSDWTVSIDEDAQTKTFVSSIMPTLVYPEDSHGFLNMLDALALDAPSYAASNSSRVLAQLLTLPLSQANDEQSVLTQMGLISTHVNAWRQVLIDATTFLYGRLPNNWHELPLAGERESTADSTKRFVSQLKLHAPGLIGNTVSTGANRDADDGNGGAVFGSSGAATQLVVRRASRALTCLQNIVSYGRLKAMPRRFAHSASYRDVDIVLDLQLHSVHALTQQPAEAKAGPVRLPISLAGNAYMGAVRLQAAKSASEYVGRAVEAQYLRVIGTGRDFSNDNQQLSTTTITSCIMVAPCAAPLPFADPARRPLIDLADPCPFIISGDGTSSERKDIEQGQEERHQQLFYGVLLALAQAQPPQELSASLESVREFNGLQVQARNLLNVLPTCTQAVADVEAVLSMAAEKAPKALYDLASCPDMSQDQRASAITMTRQQQLPNDRRINAQVLQYLAEVFCSLIRPADNPLEDEEMAQQRAHRALDALRNLFESHVITALFELAVEHPFAGGPNTALATHAGLLLIASDVIDAIAAELTASSNTRGVAPSQQQQQQQQQQGTATGSSGIALPSENVSKVIHSLARFALAALHAALSKYRPPALLHEASASRAEGCLQRKPSGSAYGPSEALLMQQGEMLSKRALELLARCMNLDPSVARAITAPPTAPPHAADEEQGPGVSESRKKGADGAHLAALVNQLLSHDSQSLRGLTSAWLVRIADASQEMRQWAFVGVICPIVLGSAEANAEQSELCSRFLSSIGDNVEEIQQASEVLDALVQHLLRNARDEKSSASLGTAAENAMALFKRLECYNVDSARELVSVLLNQALFPEVDLLAEATREAIQHGAERAAALVLQRYPHVLHAARRTSNCRECCMDLVSELITHDRGCWEIGCAALHRLMEASAAAFLRQTDNKPLTTLRPCGALAGLHNGGATCYMNATFQQLYMQPTVRRLVLSAPTVPIGEQDESVFHQVQRAFAHLAAGIEPSFEPRGFWRAFKDYEGRPVNIREHQDAYEFFTRLQDSVDEHLRSVNAPPAIQAALGGSFATVMTVPGRPDLLSERDEDFYQISLDVRGKKGLIESLDSYVAPESLDGPNQWLCEALGTKVDAEKRTLIRRLPHTLMLHLKRFEWDHETWTRWKVKYRFEFPMRLNMKPYTVEGSMEVEVCHATTRDESDAMDATKQQASPSSPSSRADIDRENARYVYELRGVVVHSGTAFAGHYYSYIQDRTTKRWHCFDDVNVDSWDPRCLEEDCFGGKYVPEGTSQEYDRPHSAYMLVYERVVGEDSIATRASSTGDTLASDAAEKTVMVEQQRGPSVRPREGGRADEEALTQPAMPKADVSSPSSSGQPSPGGVLGAEDPVASMHAAGMHASLQADISWGNVRRLAVAHLLGFEFMTVFQVIATEARFAAGGGVTRPRKAQRIAGLTSPGGGTLAMARNVASMTAASQGLARLTTRRGGGPHTSGNSAAGATTSDAHGSARCGGDLGMVLAQAVSLFMEYMCRIAARGPMDLANHVGAPFTSRKSRAHICQSNLSIVDNCPAAAHAVLRFTGSPRTSQAFAAALECEIEAIFAAARLLVCRAARSVLFAEGMDAAAAGMAPTIDELFAYVKSSVQRRPKSYWLWEPILSTLAQLATNIFDDEADAALLFTPHLQVLLDVGRPLVNTAHRLPAADRIDAEFPGCYLTLLSLVLRQFSTSHLAGMALPHEEGAGNVDGEDATMLEDDAARRGDVGEENPELLHPRGVQGAPDPLAVEAWDFLFADPDFLRRLLYPGALSGDGPRRLLVWLTWNNSSQRTALVRAFLGHILFDCQQDIVSMLIDVPPTIEAVGIGDNCVEERYKEMLFGAAPPEHDPQAAAVEGLVSAAARAKSHARMMALTRAVLLMEEAQPLAWCQAWQWAEEVRLTAETGAEWAAKQLTRVREFEDVLADDPDKKQAWEEKLREAGDDCSWNYRTTELDTHLMRLVGDDGALWQGFWDNGGEGAGEEQCGEGQQQGTSTGSGWEAYDETYDGGADNRYQAGNERQGEGDKENTQQLLQQQQQQPFTDKIAAGAAAPSLQQRSLTHALGLGYGLIHGSGFASRQGASVAGVSAGASNPLSSLSALRTIGAAPASEPQPRGADIVAGGGHGNGKDDEDVVAEITFDEDIADEEGGRGCGE